MTTGRSCQRFLGETGLSTEIDTILAELVDDDPAQLEAVSRQLSERILATPLPKSIRQAVAGAADISI